jgi:2-iminobutanoate/2-iminopropanoate deaminase
MGIEPTTYSLGSCRSTTELRPRPIKHSETRRWAARVGLGCYSAASRDYIKEFVPMPSDEIEVLSPAGAIRPTGTWSLAVRAGDFVFVAGMRGIDPVTNMLVDGAEARIRQAFLNMKTIIEAAGGTLHDAVRLVVYVTDMDRYRPMVNKIQEGLWAGSPYPPRTIVEVSRLNQDDIVEVEGTFFCPAKRGM